MKFLVWCPDRGETRESAEEIDEKYAHQAAETWAEKAHLRDPDFDQIEVAVAAESRPETRWTVAVECIPSFSATEIP